MNDLRFALRQLIKNPAFSVTALATVAICLGANLAIFAVIDSILLRPLPFPKADQLVTIFNTYPKAGVENDSSSLTNYYERRGNLPAFSTLSIFRDSTEVVGETGFTRLLNLMTKPRGDERLREEIEPHIAARSEENIPVGMPSEEPRRHACLEFAAVEANPEDYHAERASHS
jgi:hypothetical protein